MYTYPYVNGAGQDLSAADVHHFLRTPTLVARRVADLAKQRFLADYLLSGRYDADSGSVAWLIDDSLYTNDDLRTIAPGGDYPLTTAGEGTPEEARVQKEGQDGEITDEAIKALKMDPVEKQLRKQVNRTVARVDGKALAVIGSEVTATHASAAWTGVAAIIAGVMGAQVKVEDLDLGLSPDTCVLKGGQYASVVATLVAADVIARGLASEVMRSGVMTDVLGLNWARSNHVPFNDPLLIDREQLGGIATQNLGSPGYVQVNGTLGIQTKTWRPTDSDRDLWRVRVRRVGTAVVTEPRAGIRITGTGL